MTRLACIQSLLCALALGAQAADAPTTAPEMVSIQPRLEKGRKLALYMLRSDVRTGRPDLGFRGRTPVDLEVVESGPKGLVIAWTLGKTELVDAKGKVLELPAANPMLEVNNGLRLEFELDETLSVVALKNREQALAKIHQVIDLIANSTPEAEREKLKTAMLKVFESGPFLENAFSKEVNLFFALAGVELPASGALEGDVDLPLPMGEATIPTRQRAAIERMDADSIVVRSVAEADPKLAADAMRKMLAAMSEQAGTPAPDEKDIPEFQFKDETRHVIDRKTGLPRSAELKRTAVIGDKSRVQTFQVMRREDWPAPEPEAIRFFGVRVGRSATQPDRGEPPGKE